jgi:hypothetical protein
MRTVAEQGHLRPPVHSHDEHQINLDVDNRLMLSDSQLVLSDNQIIGSVSIVWCASTIRNSEL